MYTYVYICIYIYIVYTLHTYAYGILSLAMGSLVSGKGDLAPILFYINTFQSQMRKETYSHLAARW